MEETRRSIRQEQLRVPCFHWGDVDTDDDGDDDGDDDEHTSEKEGERGRGRCWFIGTNGEENWRNEALRQRA